MVRGLALFVLLPCFVGFIGGYGVRALVKASWRRRGLVSWMIAPFLAYTASALSAEASQGMFWAWYISGLTALGAPMVLWMGGALLGYTFTRRRASRSS
jgi:hypothetical protein